MSVTIVKGDLLEAKEKYIAHQCNAVSNQAGGLAHYLFKKFPHADIYKDRPFPYQASGPNFPGHIRITGDGINNRFVINMIAQYYPGSPINENSLLDGATARLAYFHKCLGTILKINNVESIAFPYMIGCGLAGGDWSKYKQLIEAFSRSLSSKQSGRVVIYRNE